MNIRQRLTPEETVTRILAVAEEHFRRVGYGKTAVADIADELGMSSANIYRFFPSKSAINEAICNRMLDECHAMMREVSARPGTVAERLKGLLMATHSFNSGRYTGERRMHEMVAVAMEENWESVQRHLTFVVETIAGLIAEGIASGEFRPVADLQSAALTIKQCCCSILHPMMIAECLKHDMGGPDQAERITGFVVDALKV
ncbi:MAG: TetR/AcrR family transcriptional regulator [Beijerinckiaceae bacterium]